MGNPRTPPATTAKKQAFVDAYLGPAKFNATEAARLAGSKGKAAALGAIGSRYLRDAEVVAILRERMFDGGVKESELLGILLTHARGTMADYLTTEGDVRLDLVKAREAKRLGLLRSFKEKSSKYFDQKGGEHVETTVEIKLYDAQVGIDKLLKVLGSYRTDEHDEVAQLPDLDRVIDGLLKLGAPRENWPPGFQRHYEARTKRIASQQVKP
jgi:phage terminase small subunit